MLLGEVVARVQLEDEHMVDARRPPAVYVHADKEDELDDQQWAAVQPKGDLQVLASHLVEDRGHDHSDEEHYEAAREEAHLERGPGALFFAQRGHAQPLHGSLAIARLQLLRDQRLRLIDDPIDVLICVEVGRLHLILSPFRAIFYVE